MTACVAAVLLNKSKVQNADWVVIALGWGFAVMVGAYAVGQFSGAHLNPAVTVGLWISGAIEGSDVPEYFAGEFLGAAIGALLVFLAYYQHFGRDRVIQASSLRSFNRPGDPQLRVEHGDRDHRHLRARVRHPGDRRQRPPGESGLTTAGGVPGGRNRLSLGGPTGYAINPARDLSPRIMHAILPIPGKGLRLELLLGAGHRR